jgi:hypothetical protein
VFVIPVLRDVDHILAWPACFTAACCVVLLLLVIETTNVALFAGEKRSERAVKILKELIKLISRGGQ